MSEARSLMPTDLLALVSYNGRGYSNQAWTRERLGTEDAPSTLSLLADQFLAFARGRSVWVNIRRQRLQGLVSARPRGGRQAWEIDYLIATSHHDVVPNLLESTITDAGRSGAEKLFLRLVADSDLLVPVREAGFIPYQEEILYSRPARLDIIASAELRPVVPSDSYLLYRLYNQATPETVRRLEAATFNEWHAAQERQWLKGGLQLVQQRDGEACAWARAAKLEQGVLIDLLTDAQGAKQATQIVGSVTRALEAATETQYVLLPRNAESLAGELESAGFTARQDFISLMRRTTRPQTYARKLLPAIAETAIGV